MGMLSLTDKLAFTDICAGFITDWLLFHLPDRLSLEVHKFQQMCWLSLKDGSDLSFRISFHKNFRKLSPSDGLDVTICLLFLQNDGVGFWILVLFYISRS